MRRRMLWAFPSQHDEAAYSEGYSCVLAVEQKPTEQAVQWLGPTLTEDPRILSLDKSILGISLSYPKNPRLRIEHPRRKLPFPNRVHLPVQSRPSCLWGHKGCTEMAPLFYSELYSIRSGRGIDVGVLKKGETENYGSLGKIRIRKWMPRSGTKRKVFRVNVASEYLSLPQRSFRIATLRSTLSSNVYKARRERYVLNRTGYVLLKIAEL
jgi:hypothetical protein